MFVQVAEFRYGSVSGKEYACMNTLQVLYRIGRFAGFWKRNSVRIYPFALRIAIVVIRTYQDHVNNMSSISNLISTFFFHRSTQ